MNPIRLALDVRVLVAPQPYCTIVVCEGFDALAVPKRKILPKLRTKFFPLHTCQQLEIIYRVSRAAKRLSARLAVASSSMSLLRLRMKFQLFRTLAPMLLLAKLVHL